MNHAAINERRKQVLLNPTGTNIEQLINEIEKSGSDALKRDITILRVLVLTGQQGRPESKPAPVPVPIKTPPPLNKTASTEARSRRNASKPKATLKVPASAQWCFINGLGDMDWIEGSCVRQCLEDRLLHAQALPSPEKFEVSITGKLQLEPVLQICTPFHSISFIAELNETTETEEWKTCRYLCSTDQNEEGCELKDILYELAFSVTAGDYFRELSYTF